MNNKRLYPILLIVFTNILGAGVILPVLPMYAEGQFGGTVLQITALSAAFFAAQFLAAPRLGRLSDRFGRRPVLIISQIGTVLAFLLFVLAEPLGREIDALSTNFPISGGMLVLYAARILDGITGGNITAAQAYVSDIAQPEERTQSLGMLQATFGVGFIFGPAFGGVLSRFGSTAPFVGALAITTLTLALTAILLTESLPPENRTEKPTRRRAIPLSRLIAHHTALPLLLIIGFVGTLAFSALQSTFALFADRELFADFHDPHRVQTYTGLMLAMFGFMQVVTQVGLLRPLIAHFGEQRLLLIGEAAVILSMILMATIGRGFWAIALFAPFAFGMGINEPSLQSLISRFGGEADRGRMLGLYQSTRSLALIFGPIWSGFVFQSISPRAVFGVGAAVMGLAFTLSAVLQHIDIPMLGTN